MWSKRQRKSTLFRSYRQINLVISVLFVVYFCVAFFISIDTLEKQRYPLLSGVEKILQSSTDLIEKRRLGGGDGGGIDYVKSPNNTTSDNDKLEENKNVDTSSSSSFSFNHRFILFRKLAYGQGAGNVMNGLLAATLLGQEFNRTVCVEEGYREFHAAFEAIDPYAIQYCPNITKNVNNQAERQSRLRLQLINFLNRNVDECSVRDKLASPTKVIVYEGNTYPRWPHVQESDFFFRHYRARQALLDILPYYDYRRRQPAARPPSTVVHLRAPDPEGADQRKGLDENSLMALGAELPRNATFLVTNKVDWFKRFEENYGWSHSNWSSVVHSVLSISRESRGGGAPKVNSEMQNLQMWADWYILLRAKKIYHTNSDFSNSAVHWMNIDAYVIEGYNTTSQSLILKRESWLIDGETPAINKRTTGNQEVEVGMQLRGCDDGWRRRRRRRIQELRSSNDTGNVLEMSWKCRSKSVIPRLCQISEKEETEKFLKQIVQAMNKTR